MEVLVVLKADNTALFVQYCLHPATYCHLATNISVLKDINLLINVLIHFRFSDSLCLLNVLQINIFQKLYQQSLKV